MLDPKTEHFLPKGTITAGLICCCWWEFTVKGWNIACRDGLGPGGGGAWLCSTSSEMLKTYHSKAIREPSTRIQANFWYRRKSLSLYGEEGEDDKDKDNDDFSVDNLEFDMANSR